MATGLLGQLPDLGELEQVRGSVEHGLDGALQGVLRDPARLIGPLTDGLGSISSAFPDLVSLVGPLAGQSSQIGSALPSGLDQQVGAVAPLLSAAEHAVSSSALAPILDDLRAGKSMNEIARDALEVTFQQALGSLPGLTGSALPAGAPAAVNDLLAAAGSFGGGGADPEALASFLAEHVVGVPVEPLRGVLAVHDHLFGTLDTLLATASTSVEGAQGALVGSLDAAATRFEALNPTAAADWAALATALNDARVRDQALLDALRAIPGQVYARLDELDPSRYVERLRASLLPLGVPAASGSGHGAFTALEGLATSFIEPLDELAAALATTTPGAFSGQLRAGLDQLLSVFDVLADAVQNNPVLHFFDDFKQIVDRIAAAIQSVQTTIQEGIRAVLSVVDSVVGEFNQVRQRVESAIRTLQAAIDAIDVDALAHAVEGVLNAFNDTLAAIPLKDLKDKLDQALTTVDGLVRNLAETARAALHQVEGFVSALEGLSFDPIARPVIGAMDTIHDTVAALHPDLLPDPLKSSLHEAVAAFKAQFGGDPGQWFESQVTRVLGELFDRAAKAVADVVNGVRSKIHQFAEAIGKLDPAKLLEPVTTLFQEVTDALAGLNARTLLAPAQKLIDDGLAALAAISPDRLLRPLEDAFEREVMAPIARFKPSDLLAPLIQAFQPFEDLVGKLDFSEAIGGMGAAVTDFLGSARGQLSGAVDGSNLPGVGGAANQPRQILDLLNPASTVDDWATALNHLLGSYNPSAFLAPIRDALAPVDNVLTGASDELLVATFSRLKPLAAVTDLVSGAATTRAFGAALERVAAAIERNQPTAVVAALSGNYRRCQEAFGRIDAAALPPNLRPRYEAVRVALAALDPATTIAAMAGVFAPLPARLRQLARPIDLTDLATTFGGALSTLAGRLPGFLLGDLTPGNIRAGLAAFSPTALIARVDARFQAFLQAAQRFGPSIQAAVEGLLERLGDKLVEVSPAALFEKFDGLFKPIRDAIAAVSPRALAQTLDEAYATLVAKLATIHPKVLREAVQPLFDTVVRTLTDLKVKVLAAIGAAIDAALTKLRATLAALDPRAVIVGLGNLFAVIRQALDELNLEPLLNRLLAAVDKLRSDLTNTLHRCSTRFDAMLGALSV